MLLVVSMVAGCVSSSENNGIARSEKTSAKNGKWETIGYGGGGAMFYPSVSPHNPDVAFVVCDMTGSYVTYDGGEAWRMLNLRNHVHSNNSGDYFVFDPNDSNVVYARTMGLFKSVDKGFTWTLIYPSPAIVESIVSKGDHAEETLVTTDGGEREVQAFAIDPIDSKKLYAVIAVDKSPAFYTSDDSGASWEKEYPLKDAASSLFINPSSPENNRTIYITGKRTITARDNGKWMISHAPKDVNEFITYSGGFDLKLNKFIIYAVSGKSYFDPKGVKSGIFFTDNGGQNWENRQDGLTAYNLKGAEDPEWRTVSTSSRHPEVVYVSYNRMKGNGDSSFIGVAVSSDYGKTWSLAWKDILTHANGNKNIPSANFNSAWINERFGPTWGENPFSIGVSPTNPDICYATDFGRTVKTVNRGKTWEQAYTNKTATGWRSRGLEVTTGYNINFDPFDKQHAFICNTDIGLMESRDGALSWSSATQNNGIPRRWQNSTYWLAFDPEVKGRAWAVMSDVHDLPRPKMWRKNGVNKYDGGIVITEDAGATWKPVSESIGEAALTHILIDPSSDKQSRTLYACAFGKGVYKSADGGKTWAQKNKGITGSEPFAWRITRSDKDGSLFLVVSRRSDDGSIGNELDGALYRSDDGAESWQPITMPQGTNGPTSIVVNDKNPARLLLSAWGVSSKGKFAADTGGGIFVSPDGGKSWKQVIQKDQHIHDITYDARNNTYYACGFNGSAYRSEDEGETWSRIKGYNFKWGKRVEPDPRDPSKIFVITFGGGTWYGPAKGDESSPEDILTPFVTR
ncbi:MAG: hypothetical protein ABI687_01535 [Flavitalea sp.]